MKKQIRPNVIAIARKLPAVSFFPGDPEDVDHFSAPELCEANTLTFCLLSSIFCLLPSAKVRIYFFTIPVSWTIRPLTTVIAERICLISASGTAK